MKKINKNKLKITLSLLAWLIIVILIFNNKIYSECSFFSKLFIIPFEGITRFFCSFLDFRISYFLVITMSLFVVVPIFSISKTAFKRLLLLNKELIKISKEKCTTDEQQIQKTNKMLNLYIDKGIGIIEFIYIILFCFLGTNFFSFMFSKAFVSKYYTVGNLNVLWFSLNSKDPLYILPILSLILMMIPLVIKIYNLICLKKKKQELSLYEYKKQKTSYIFTSLIHVSGYLLFTYSLFVNSMFALFIIITYTTIFVKKGISKIKQKRVEFADERTI